MNLQTGENYLHDSRIFVGFGIDCVSQKWHNTANVPALFVKTLALKGNDLAGDVKTNLAPARLPANEGRHNAIGARHG